MYTQLEWDITLIDTGLTGAEIAACYLLKSRDQYAIIETGNFETCDRILALLEQRNISRDQVTYVIPTHVHLDHAGGASDLMAALPEAKLVIHPQGARHMIDPSKLIAGAMAVYGEETYRALYGDIKPIAEDRIIVAEDNSSLTFGERTLVFRDTPGHARHHFCVWDETSRGWFTGDTFGIGYLNQETPKGRMVFPSSTPVQFDPQALLNSIELLMSYEPKTMYLTHYGAMEVNRDISDYLCQQIHGYINIIESFDDTEYSIEELQAKLTEYTLQCLRERGSTVDTDELRKTIYNDIKLNSHGLKIWYSRLTS